MASSEEKLKRKINALIERVSDLGSDLSGQMTQIQLLEEEIRLLRQRENNPGDRQFMKLEGESKMFAFMRDFCLIARLLIEDAAYIEYSYKTKNSEDYYKIEQGVFENYVCKYAQMNLKEFTNFCVDLGLVKSEKNRRCTYNSAEIRVYYVNKLFVDTAAKREEKQEEETLREA